MREAPVDIAAQIPGATTAVLEDQTHEVDAKVLAPVLARHLTRSGGLASATHLVPAARCRRADGPRVDGGRFGVGTVHADEPGRDAGARRHP